MDEFPELVMLLIIFIAYVQGIIWLAIGGLIILVIITKSLLVFIISAGGIATLEILEIQEYWYIILFIVAAIVLIGKYRERRKSEFSSGEMLDMLDEY